VRVLIASHSGGLRGGAERCVLELAQGLHADGRAECVVALPMRGELSVALEHAGIECRHLAAPTWLVDESPPWPHDPARWARRAVRSGRALRAVPAWARLVGDVAPDAVVTSTTASPVPALAARRAGVPHLWWVHEFTTLDHHRRYALGEPLSQRLIGRLSERVVVNSHAVAAHYSPPIDPGRIVQVELGIEVEPVARNRPAAGRLRLLLLGRKAPGKGCELALRAVAASRARPADVSLRMVGPSLHGYDVTLWHLAEELGVLDHVEFVEYAADARPHFEWSNAVLMCSYGEAFGRVTVEALKHGRPVIGVRGGATAEIVRDGCTGLLVEPGDVDGLAAAVGRCAQDPGFVEKMSVHAIADTRTRFTLRREVDTFVACFDAVRRRGVDHG
jgi:glycosyltransferase involved in cell wall biosynthesis